MPTPIGKIGLQSRLLALQLLVFVFFYRLRQDEPTSPEEITPSLISRSEVLRYL
jgi:hypothetical protein